MSKLTDDMTPCCRRYIDSSLADIREWLEQAERNDDVIKPVSFLASVRDQADVLVKMLEGADCPWHENAAYYMQMDDIIHGRRS